MKWLLDLNPHGDERPVMALVSANAIGVLMPRLNAASCRQQTDVDFYEWSDDEGPDSALQALITDCAVPNDGPEIVIDETMRADFALLLLSYFDAPNHRFTGDTIAQLRAQKDPLEMTRLRASAALNDRAFSGAIAALKPGVTEIEIKDVIAKIYEAAGAKMAFGIVAFGANSAFPHHHTGKTALVPGMTVLVDAGCILDGYPSDMTRTGWFKHAPDNFDKIADLVTTAVSAALSAAKPGVKASQIDAAARDVIAQAGYGAQFLHRTGHGLGIDVHEPPYLTGTSDTILAEGNVFTIEPGIYLPDQFGIRLEETVILHADGPEIITKFPISPFTC